METIGQLKYLCLLAVLIPSVSIGGDYSDITERLDNIEQAVEYPENKYIKQDILEVLHETGMIGIAERVEKKIDVSNEQRAEGNSLMREMIRRMEAKDEKDIKQDENIKKNTERSVSNTNKLWAITTVISILGGLTVVAIKRTLKTKELK